MTTYTAIPNADIDADSPLTTGLMTLLRDNAIAITEGAAGAPNIQPAALAADVGAFIEITQTVISTDATIDFTGLDATYDLYKIVLDNVRTATDGASIYTRVGTGGTPTWQTGASSYAYAGHRAEDDGTLIGIFTSSGAFMRVTHTMGNAVLEACSGIIFLFNPTSAAGRTNIQGSLTYGNSDAVSSFTVAWTSGQYKSATAVTAFRVYASTGNLTSGTITLYGLKT